MFMDISSELVHSLLPRFTATVLGTSMVTIGLIESVAKGEVEFIIPGYMYIHPLGRSFRYQTGIQNDQMIPGLRHLVEAVHKEGGKIVTCRTWIFNQSIYFSIFQP